MMRQKKRIKGFFPAIILLFTLFAGTFANAAPLQTEPTDTAVPEDAAAADAQGEVGLQTDSGSLTILGTDRYDYAYQVLDHMNQQREAAGLAMLVMDQSLLDAAMQRAAEQAVRIGHYRPNGMYFPTVSEKASGENTAIGQSSAELVMETWTNDLNAGANIVNEDFLSAGVGCFINDGICYWAALFGTSSAITAPQPANIDGKREIEVEERFYVPECLLMDEEFRTGAQVNVNSSQKLSFFVRDSDLQMGYWSLLEPSNFTWSSSDPSVAVVDQTGKVTAKKPGSATIFAAYKDTRIVSDYRLMVHFTDVNDSSKYYYHPVYWAAAKGITNGYMTAADKATGLYGKFGFDLDCKREHVVTFLWRLFGKPEPKTTVCPFPDVTPDKYYYKAVLWAAEEEITKGYSDGTFRPEDPCLREHVVTFLWRSVACPEPGIVESPFNDIQKSDYYFKAVLWAAQNKITNGYSSGPYAGGFGPKLTCLREHVVTFLWRAAGRPSY